MTSKVNSKILCMDCGREKAEGQFYLSNNSYYKNYNYRFPTCKLCLKKNINTDDMTSINDILMQLNRPFIKSVWDDSVLECKKTNKELFGIYYKNIILNYKTYDYKSGNNQKDTVDNGDKNITKEIQHEDGVNQLQITSEMRLRWGNNYSLNEYLSLEEFYNNMKSMNKIDTPQEEVYLKKLATISLKMDTELENGNYGQVKQLGDLFSKYMGDSQFRAIDKTDIDKTGGVRSFGVIFAEVEKEDHIPPWEEYRKIKGLKQDVVDLTIMHIENFTLRLNKVERMIEPPADTPKISEVDDIL